MKFYSNEAMDYFTFLKFGAQKKDNRRDGTDKKKLSRKRTMHAQNLLKGYAGCVHRNGP